MGWCASPQRKQGSAGPHLMHSTDAHFCFKNPAVLCQRKVFILQFITFFLVMVLFFHVLSTKGKTSYRDNEPACHLNSIMSSDHSLSVLQRWGTHTWVPHDVAVFSSQFGGLESCQSLAQLEESMEEAFQRGWMLTEVTADIWKVHWQAMRFCRLEVVF